MSPEEITVVTEVIYVSIKRVNRPPPFQRGRWLAIEYIDGILCPPLTLAGFRNNRSNENDDWGTLPSSIRFNGAFMGLPRQSAEQLFVDALELQPEKRQTFVDRACRGDPALRRRVEELLRKEERAGSFLRWPIVTEQAGRCCCWCNRLQP